MTQILSSNSQSKPRSHYRHIFQTVVVTAVLAGQPWVSRAADIEDTYPVPTPSGSFDTRRYGDFRDTLHDWKVTVGAGALYRPEYEGSDRFELSPVPVVSAQFGDRVSVDMTGVTVALYEASGLKVGLKGGFDPGREEDDSIDLRGLGDVDPGGIIGGVISYEVGAFEAYARLDRTIGGSDGLTGTLGAKASYRTERFLFSADISGTWADDKHMQSYFGVNAVQSAASGLSQHEAGSGVKRIDAKASVTYILTENWLVTGAAGAGFLVGDAKDSPVVRDDVQPFAMLGIAYRF